MGRDEVIALKCRHRSEEILIPEENLGLDRLLEKK
jgi:hypothetical protein